MSWEQWVLGSAYFWITLLALAMGLLLWWALMAPEDDSGDDDYDR